MKKLTLLIALFSMILTGCVTRNPEKAKKKIAVLVDANPSAANFEVNTEEVKLEELGLQVEGNINNKEVKEATLKDLLGFTDSEKSEVIKTIKRAQKRGSSTRKVGEKTVRAEVKGEGVTSVVITTPKKVKVNKKYTVQPPKEKKKFLDLWQHCKNRVWHSPGHPPVIYLPKD